jgi:general secretion pathway protein E
VAAAESSELATALRQAREQHRAGAGSVLDVLLRMPGWTHERLAEALPRLAGVHVLKPGADVRPDFGALSSDRAREWHCVILRAQLDLADEWVAAEDPWDEKLERRIARHLGRCPPMVAVRRDDMNRWLGAVAAATDAEGVEAAQVTTPAVEGPVVAFVDQALRAAYSGGASDVHFECDRAGVTAKHRLDGVMQRYARLDGAQRAVEVISRIKVMAQLDITERRLPQDGRLQVELAGQRVDVRVSIMPSVHGEDAVLRLLDKARLRQNEADVSLAALGFGAEAAQLIRDLALRPSGLFLVTGPTGSGKTTTVYATLAEIHDGLEKIITIEDPVEYELQGVLQIPVNERKGLTFARGLRSLLRHDPDRILVGEIRDAETAEIAVQSALTGHLVFTTVHANSVADVVARFRHFGLDMFGFMSALNGVIVQRLLRRLCPQCMQWREHTAAESRWLVGQGRAEVERVPVSIGCAHCHGSGFRGRSVLAEIHQIDDLWRDHVTGEQPLTQLRGMAQDRGVVPLSMLAAAQVADGQTTMEEVRRVVGW